MLNSPLRLAGEAMPASSHTANEGTPISGQTLPTVTRIVPGYVVHRIDDNRTAPLLSKGDFVVVDTADTMPVSGGMFLVQWSNRRRSLVSTRPAACEHVVINGESCLLMRKDGLDTVWYFDDVVNRFASLCDGPYDLDHMRTKIIGRLVGVVDGEAATRWAVQQVGEYEFAIDREAREAAESFDPELWIDLCDRTGQVSVLSVQPGHSSILSWFVDHNPDEATRIYREYRAVFDAYSEGGTYSRAKLEAALRKAGRVITLKGGEWHADPKMPAHVHAAHFSEQDEAA